APIAIVVTGPTPLARAFESTLASVLADAKKSPVVLAAGLGDGAERAAREQGLRSLTRIDVACEGGQLIVRGDGFSTWQNFWSGRTPSRSAGAVVVAHRRPADPATLTLAGVGPAEPPPTPVLAAADAGPPPPDAGPLLLELQSLLLLPSRPAAVAAGDLDQDGASELGVLLDDAVWIVDANGKVRAQAPLSGPKSSTPAREPFGVLQLQPGKVIAWSARRAQPEAFAWTGGALVSRGAVEPATLPVSPAPGLSAFAPSLRLWGRTYELPAGVQAVSALEGAALLAVADGSGRFVRAQGVQAGKLGAVGCGSAIASFGPGLGSALVATTTKSWGDQDTVRVVPLLDAESAAARGASVLELKPSWQGTLAKGRAVVAAAADDGARGGFVVFGLWHTNDTGELVALRRVSP
ncbi:MAG: hypothetical protein IT565_14155, partial [Rhodospirillales bacterium]|nr:hypothetical protein [Rhodospirillales bacterium]